MNKSFLRSSHVFNVFLICGFCFFCGFASISDIETAIIEKDYKTSKVLAEKFIARKSTSDETNQARYYLGISELGLAHYSAARAAFKRVMRATSSDSLYEKAWLGVIDSLGMEQDFSEDLKQAEQFLMKRPDSEFLSVIYLKLGRAHLKLSHWEKAQDYLNKVVHDFPKSLEAHTAQQLLEEKRYFAIQVGSFLDQSRATALVEELKGKGEYAYLVETQDHEGRVFYRVRVGELKNLHEANTMQKRLSNQGYPTHIYP